MCANEQTTPGAFAMLARHISLYTPKAPAFAERAVSKHVNVVYRSFSNREGSCPRSAIANQAVVLCPVNASTN